MTKVIAPKPIKLLPYKFKVSTFAFPIVKTGATSPPDKITQPL